VNTAREIAAALGKARREGPNWRCRWPVRESTLALRDADHGLLIECHAGCSRADVLQELHRRGLVDGEVHQPPPDVDAVQRRAAEELRHRESGERVAGVGRASRARGSWAGWCSSDLSRRRRDQEGDNRAVNALARAVRGGAVRLAPAAETDHNHFTH
jgi:hypothetical protein